MTETNTSPNPAEFDFEAWIDDARLPEGSETVYKRADLVAKIDHLARQIRVETDALAGEKTSASTLLNNLTKERLKLMEAFARSEVTFYLRALSSEKIQEIISKHPDASGDDKEKRLEAQVMINRELLAASIVAMESPTLEKRDVNLSVPMIVVMEQKIGAAQLAKLLVKRSQVQSEAPVPDADFLPGASGTSQDSGR